MGQMIPSDPILLWVAAFIMAHMVEGCRIIHNLRRLHAQGPTRRGLSVDADGVVLGPDMLQQGTNKLPGLRRSRSRKVSTLRNRQTSFG